MEIPRNTALYGATGTAVINTALHNNCYWSYEYKDGHLSRIQYFDMIHGLLLLDLILTD